MSDLKFQVPGPRLVRGVRGPGLLPVNLNVATEASNASASDRAVIIGPDLRVTPGRARDSDLELQLRFEVTVRVGRPGPQPGCGATSEFLVDSGVGPFPSPPGSSASGVWKARPHGIPAQLTDMGSESATTNHWHHDRRPQRPGLPVEDLTGPAARHLGSVHDSAWRPGNLAA